MFLKHKIILLFVSHFCVLSVFAATKTWDGGGADNNWTTAANWDSDVAPVAGDDLIFDGSTRTSPSNDFVAATNFTSVTFAATASAFTLSGNSVTITGGASAITASNASLTMTIGNNVVFSTSAPTITSTSGGTLALTGTIDNGGLAITVSSGGTTTLSGIISGTGSLVKSGADALTLSGANTFSGGVTLSAGTLNINHATALGTGTFVIANGTTIDNTSGGTITMTADNPMTWNGSFTFTGSNILNMDAGAVDIGAASRTVTASASTLIIGGIISGTGAITKAGAGALTLSGANTFSSGVSLSAGQLNINNATALGTGTFTIANGTIIDNTSGGTITMTADNPMTWNGNFTFTGSNALNMDAGAVAMGAATRTVTVSASTLTVGGTISGTSGLTKAGAGTMTLGSVSAANWTGSFTVSAGTLNLVNPGNDNYKATSWTVSAGATLNNTTAGNIITNDAVITVTGTWDMNNQKDAIGYIAGAGNINNFGTAAAGDGFEIDLPATGTGSDFSGVISGPGTFNVRGGQGAGKQVLSGLNTYTGPTYIRKGTLSINTIKDVSGGASAVGAPTTAANGTIPIGSTTTTGTLEYTGGVQSTDRVIDLAGTTGGAILDQSGTGLLTFSSNLTATGAGAKTFTLQGSTAGTGLIAGVIPDGSGTTSLAKSGTGTWTLSGANTFGGTTTVTAGTLQLGTAGVIPNACAVTVTSPGLLDMNTFNETVGSIAGSGTIDNVAGGGTPLLSCGGNHTSTTFSGVIQNTSGVLSLTKVGSGTLTLSGANTYTGTTTISAGALQLGAANRISNSSNFIAAGGTFSTGSAAGYSETMGTLTLNANTIIALGTGNHSLNFAASDGTTWTAATLLRITGWQGAFNCSSGTSGKIYTGNSAELSGGKLAQIFFSHPISGLPFTACQLNDGEIVPTSTLPVKLISFEGELKENKVHLYWITASEINSDYFEILRSSDALHFESIGKVSAAGNSNDFLSYTFVDSLPLSGYSYYKLIQYDFNGANETFHLVPIVNKEESHFKISALYPNPTLGLVTVSFQSETRGTCFLSLMDDQGKEVYSAIVAAIEGENQFNLGLGSFSSGKYFLRITNLKNESAVSQVIVQH